MEIIGGGTDVNDPEMQHRHFVRQRERQEAGSEESPASSTTRNSCGRSNTGC